MDGTSDDNSKQLSISQEEPFQRISFITCSSGINGQSVVSLMLGPITQLLSLRASNEIPRVPVSAGLSRLRTWCHSSIVVDWRISSTRLATNTVIFGCGVQPLQNCSTICPHVDMILTVWAFSRVASRAA